MSLKALVYAYVLGGFTFIPLLICAAVAWTIYTSVPVGDPDPAKLERKKLSEQSNQDQDESPVPPVNDQPKPRKAWLIVRRTFEEKEPDGSYVNMMRAYLDSRSKDPKRSRPKDMWYVVLKGDVLYLYEDETMTECEAAIHLSMHQVTIFPEGLADGELFTKRNSICLNPLNDSDDHGEELTSITREMGFEAQYVDKTGSELDVSDRKKEKERTRLEDLEQMKEEAKAQAFDGSTPWFIFVRTCVEMEDWYLALVHAAHYSHSSSTLEPVRPVFSPSDMNHLVVTLDEQPDVIPMRWLNALLGRIFFSFYRTKNLESFIIGRLMKKLSKVKIPTFLQNVSVTDVSVGNTPPTFSKPMLKDLTKEGDAALEIRVMYRGEIRVTVEATAIINLGQRFKTYTVKLVLAVVLRRLDGNLLVKVKRPPTNRIWYAFTQPPDMELDVEPVVSDRQIKWSMICSTIESRLKEIINESVVMPNMDDIAFFESSHLMHRGGIWADASREAFRPEKSPEQNGTVTEANGGLPTKSRSTDVLAETVATTPTEPMTISDSDRIETASAPSLSQDSAQRRSWFGNDSNLTESENEASKSSPLDRPETFEDDRGRSLNVDTSNRRATSVPASKTPPAESSEAEGQGFLQSGSTLTAESSQDGSSTHSRSRSLSSGANVLGQGNSSSEAMPSRTTNTSSFLSALKQKADKQALSNTAKEAMKKWSANWNGFKREHMGGTNHPEETADGATGSTLSGSLLKGRNYADIRAAVAGRKDQGPSDERHETSSSSRPIDIPTIKKDEDESRNAEGSSSGSSKDIEPSSSASSQSSPKTPALLRREAARAPISPPKVTTDTTHISEPTPSASTMILSSPEPEVLPPPIKTQPSQGAMMTIPGIHASHRGDIQSLGYVPPASSSSTPTESKSRTPTIPPTIQSVYRLFRSPTSNSSVLQQQQGQTRTNLGSATSASPGQSPARSEGSPPAPESNDDVTPLSLTPSVIDSPGTRTPVASRPTPPPLPPRSPSVPRPSPTPPQLPPRRDSGGALKMGEGDIAIAPSASDALRAIAEQDETKRRDINGSPELRPKANTSTRAKRTSLGAKRISTPIIFSEEPVPMHSDVDGGTSLRSDASTMEVTKSSNMRSDQLSEPDTSCTPETGADVSAKPRPPPLPPRRSSALSSS
ncbi:hypothetical protein A7U60_g7206 [Sanghuangporus baumii]|uniref:SMP-LTD domain-containing protein n=1 Tax=Sanghuangporus baumii TaxID=108892 RepID=A0A9Q5HTF4_SANBA|nr:hypothetical protein A7U60_g7206 [Sanghuangporus baumii]